MTDLIAKGGRGHKAPYETTHARIPEGIKPLVEKLSAVYRQKFLGDVNPDSNGATELIKRVEAALMGIAPQDKPVNKIDYAAVRDRILSQWRVGKRAESKERIKEALDKFIAELES